MASFFFRELQLITVFFLICNSFMSWSTSFVSLKLCVGFSMLLKFYYSVFIKVYIFVQQTHELFDFKTSQLLSILKDTHSFASRRLIFKLQQEVLKLNDICVSWSSPKMTWWQIFKSRKSKFWERLISNFQVNIWHFLLNNLFTSFLNLFISLIELKTLLNNLFISYLNCLLV